MCHSIASNIFENHMLLLGVDRYNPFRGNMSEVLLLTCTEIGCLGLPPCPPQLFIIVKNCSDLFAHY